MLSGRGTGYLFISAIEQNDAVEVSGTYTEKYINAVDSYGVADGDGLGTTAP